MYAGKFNPSPGQPDMLTDAYGNYLDEEKQIAGRLDRPYSFDQQALDIRREQFDQGQRDKDLLFDGAGRRAARDEGRSYNERSSSRDRESDSPLDFNPYGGGSRGRSGGGGGKSSGGFDVAQALHQMHGIDDATAGGSSQVGDVIKVTNGDIGPKLQAAASELATLTGASVQFAQQMIDEMLGKGRLENERYNTKTQLDIANNRYASEERMQSAGFDEKAKERKRNLDGVLALENSGGRNPMAAPEPPPPDSSTMANLMMNQGSLPRMRLSSART